MHIRIFVVRLLAVVFIFLSLLVPGMAMAESPDFSTIDDPLDGDYQLYTVDDLVIQHPKLDSGQSTMGYGVLKMENLEVSSDTYQEVVTLPCKPGERPVQGTRVGRFFGLPYDVIVSIMPYDCSDSGKMQIRVEDPVTEKITTTSTSLAGGGFVVAADDFNGDGFDDLFIITESAALVATAKDVSDVDKGMVFGPVSALGSDLQPVSDLTTGDLNGDGLMDVAWFGSDDKTLQIATVCGGSTAGTICESMADLSVQLNPLASGTDPLVVPHQHCGDDRSFAKLTAGKFSSDGTTGLVTLSTEYVGFDNSSTGCAKMARWYQFDSDFNGQLFDKIQLGKTNDINGGILDYATLTNAKLDWFGRTEQVVIATTVRTPYSGCVIPGGSPSQTEKQERIFTLTFNSDNTLSKTSATTSRLCGNEAVGIVAGHFSSINSNSDGEADFDLQIATLKTIFSNGVQTGNLVSIWQYDIANSFTPTLVSTTTTTTTAYKSKQFSGLSVGDLQGRSVRLGSPTVVRVPSHSQPSVVLGHPPMHVDYILPSEETSSTSGIINFTVVPDSFHSSYALDETQGNQSSNTDTTSHSYSSSRSGGGEFCHESACGRESVSLNQEDLDGYRRGHIRRL